MQASRILDRVESIPEDVRGPMERVETMADVVRVLNLAKRAETRPRHEGHDYSQYSVVI